MSDHSGTLAYVVDNWPGQMSETAGGEFLRALEDLDSALTLAAARTFLKHDSKGFRPTPGQLREIVQGSGSDVAERGFRAFLAAVNHYSVKPAHETPSMPEFSDAQVPRAVTAMGGFRQFLGGIPADQVDWTRKRFLDAYRDANHNGVARLAAGEVRRLR